MSNRHNIALIPLLLAPDWDSVIIPGGRVLLDRRRAGGGRSKLPEIPQLLHFVLVVLLAHFVDFT